MIMIVKALKITATTTAITATITAKIRHQKATQKPPAVKSSRQRVHCSLVVRLAALSKIFAHEIAIPILLHFLTLYRLVWALTRAYIGIHVSMRTPIHRNVRTRVHVHQEWSTITWSLICCHSRYLDLDFLSFFCLFVCFFTISSLLIYQLLWPEGGGRIFCYLFFVFFLNRFLFYAASLLLLLFLSPSLSVSLSTNKYINNIKKTLKIIPVQQNQTK